MREKFIMIVEVGDERSGRRVSIFITGKWRERRLGVVFGGMEIMVIIV